MMTLFTFLGFCCISFCKYSTSSLVSCRDTITLLITIIADSNTNTSQSIAATISIDSLASPLNMKDLVTKHKVAPKIATVLI